MARLIAATRIVPLALGMARPVWFAAGVEAHRIALALIAIHAAWTAALIFAIRMAGFQRTQIIADEAAALALGQTRIAVARGIALRS